MHEREELFQLMAQEMAEAIRDLYFWQGLAQSQMRQEIAYQEQLNNLWETNPALAAQVERSRTLAEQRKSQGFQDTILGKNSETLKHSDQNFFGS